MQCAHTASHTTGSVTLPQAFATFSTCLTKAIRWGLAVGSVDGELAGSAERVAAATRASLTLSKTNSQ